MQETNIQSGWPVCLIDWPDARAILEEKFDDREHWLLIIHGSAMRLLVEIEGRYYADERNKDFTVIAAIHCGHPFSIVAARKRHMLAYQLVSLLRQFTDAHISEREVLQRDVGIVAPDWAMDAAMELTRLFTRDDLAIVS
ncbi:MAG TPA: hypothetical protein VJZ77_05900 [Blastocatellia bacterium]|nr:hypothetical protein [Blastocatellia bacterium]